LKLRQFAYTVFAIRLSYILVPETWKVTVGLVDELVEESMRLADIS